MEKKALELALAIYRVTKLFPEGEVLINQTRKTANQILAEILTQSKKLNGRIETLIGYLEIAKNQNWIEDINFDILIKEYHNLLINLKKEKPREENKNSANPAIQEKIILNSRQRKILDKNKDNHKFRINDLIKDFPINIRTLRRDLDQLVLKGYLKKKGKGRSTFYIIKSLKKK
jgi:predicted HTH transcriptional regulator